jgi:hypothetical protein
VQLGQTGQIQIVDADKPSIAEVVECADLFERHATRCLLDFPGQGVPVIRVGAMHWAALTLYRASQFLVHREVDAKTIHEALSVPCPLPADPSVCFSVDLYFRYLPDLIALSRGIAEQDPLVERLVALAQQWPLSSVGVRGLKPPESSDLNPFLSHPQLAQLYIDRIIETADVSRLNDPRAQSLLAQTVGLHTTLAGSLPLLTVSQESTPK